MSEAEVIFLGDSVVCSGVPSEVFGVSAILGQQEPGVPLVDGFIGSFESVSDEFDGYVSVFLGGVFHPITTIFRGCLDKVCSSCDMAEKVRSLSAFYDAVVGKIVAKVDCECCQVWTKPDLCNALAGIKAKHWRMGSQSGVGRVTCGWQRRGGQAPYSAVLLCTSTTKGDDTRWSSKLARST